MTPSPARRYFALLLLLPLGFLLGACSTLEDAPSDFDLTASATEETGPERPGAWLSVGVTEFATGEAFDDDNLNAGEDLNRYIVAPPAEKLSAMTNEIVASLQPQNPHHGLGIFKVTEDLGAEELGPNLFRDAWEEGHDLVVTVTMTKNAVYYIDTTGTYVPTLIMWMLLTPIPTWWWADEAFGAEAEVKVRAYSTYQGYRDPEGVQPLFELTVAASYEAEVDDFDQGWGLFNIFSTPGGLDPEDWEYLGEMMFPYVYRRLQTSLIATLNEATAEHDAAIRAGIRKTMALVVAPEPITGVEYSGDGENLGRTAVGPEFGDDDARAVADYLGPALDLPVWTHHSLYGRAATKDAFLNAFTPNGRLGRNAREGDTVIVYFAGAGAVLDGEPYLIFSDFDPATRAGMLGANAFKAALGRFPADVVLLLDCAFGGSLGRRCANLLWDPKDTGVSIGGEAPHFGDVLAERPHVCVLSGTSGMEGANEIGSALGGGRGNGLFTSELMDFLTNPARHGNEEGTLSLTDLATHVNGTVERLSRREVGRANAQRPALFGRDLAPALFPIPVDATEVEDIPAPEEAASNGIEGTEPE